MLREVWAGDGIRLEEKTLARQRIEERHLQVILDVMVVYTSSWLSGILTTTLFLPSTLAQQPYNNWEAAYQAAEALVASWTIEEAANVTVRDGVAPGYLPFTVTDGPLGVSGGKGVSGWVTPQTLASSWDISLVEYQHKAMAQEFLAKGYSVLLGPTTGPLGRSVYGSRLFEGWGSDPWLNGKMFGIGVKAIQEQGVIASANEQETNRTASGVAENRTSSNMDDRTLHELYLWPWSDGVRNGMGSVMCVMNRVNGTIGCENDHIQNVVLKGELGFQGFIVPDATAPVNRTAGLLNGLDWNSGYDLGNISLLLDNGTLSEQTMREHATRIVATQLNLNPPQDQFPDVDQVESDIVRIPESRDFIRKAGSQSIVLLKNEGGVLPLKNVTSVGVFGLNAANVGAGPQPILNFLDYQGDTYASHLGSGGGSGTAPVGYLVSPLDALTRLASSDQTFDYRYILSDNYTVTPPDSTGAGFFLSTGVSISAYAAVSDPCLVFINAFAKEGADRRSLRDPVGDKLVNDVATYCNNTIVIMNNAGVRLVDSWIEHPNVTAVLNAGTLGQESGNSITDVLFGTVNPSGKLVYTIAKDESDYNGEICPCCECDYTEGLYIDYRHFDQAAIEPRYEFGYGLSYTTFEYSNFSIDTPAPKDIATYATGPIVQGGHEDLFDEMLTFSASISNTGDVAGAEIAQLYLTFPESAMSPVKQLRGFSKVFLEAGESQAVEFGLQRRDLSIWDTEAQKWKIEHGVFKALLGKSSRGIVAESANTNLGVMPVETLSATELEKLVENVNNHFMTLYHNGAFGQSRALGQAQRRFESWTKTTEITHPDSPAVNVPKQAKKSLQRLDFDLEDAVDTQDQAKLDRLATQILEYLESLEQLQKASAETGADISAGDKKNAKTVKHQYIHNKISDTASVQNGDWISKDYNGPLSEYTSIYRDNEISDSARVLNGDSYNGKSVFD
ncbi:hypothetical protein AC579_9842 [Pseudocercospora musae]|uniref:beta-glucosidase n=1 Tax=Pseudocercospora musae TaxID=113226 RepID=A0A139IV54_9PEZI|nr:hypothetical protein AC579_9842 [Pseudocercospora musae]